MSGLNPLIKSPEATRNNVAYVFPGQGTQHVGMGRDLYEEYRTVRNVYEQARDILGFDIVELSFEGPQEQLDLTINTQTAIFTMEAALCELIHEHIPLKPRVVAGHSLGEYGALYAAGAFELGDVLPLILGRAHYHQEAVPVGAGAMAAIIGLDHGEVSRLCLEMKDQAAMIDVSVFNAPRQVSISGHAAAVDSVIARVRGMKGVSAIKLPVSVPCHCCLLDTAAELLGYDLERLIIKDIQVPVIPNCNPDVFYTSQNAREMLKRQITSPVRWQETIEKMASMGIDTIVEIGPKKTLSGLIKRIDKRFRLLDVGSVESFRTFRDLFT